MQKLHFDPRQNSDSLVNPYVDNSIIFDRYYDRQLGKS